MTDLYQMTVDLLTPAQQEAVIKARRGDIVSGVFLPVEKGSGPVNRSLVEAGIAAYTDHGAALTSFGKSIRALLNQDRGGRPPDDNCLWYGHRYPRPVYRAVLPQEPISYVTAEPPRWRHGVEAYAKQTCTICGFRRVIDYRGGVVRQGYGAWVFEMSTKEGEKA